ncbi:hypothetical protein [Cerasicoccus maritimus]|uniref:hypothetical protein n=1 Tax=Cerasicoccus maritimus TaxID=490089 RepID=UPI0028525E38|nr:hypothetical protein [Cerasicoccus maritimus]
MKSLLAVLLMIFATTTALAQDTQALEEQLREQVPAESDPIAEQLFATSVKAMGGPGAFNIGNLSADLKLTRGPNVVDLKLFTKSPDKIRTELIVKHMGRTHEIIRGFNGSDAWVYDTSEKNPFPQKLGGSDATELKELSSKDDILLTWKERGCILKYEGPVNNRRQKNYLVKLYHPEGQTEYFYFHPKNYLVTRRGNKLVQGGAIVNVDVYMLKYDKIDGYWMPVKTETALEGEVIMKSELSNINPNQQLDDTLFEMPEVKEVWLKGKNAQ